MTADAKNIAAGINRSTDGSLGVGPNTNLSMSPSAAPGAYDEAKLWL